MKKLVLLFQLPINYSTIVCFPTNAWTLLSEIKGVKTYFFRLLPDYLFLYSHFTFSQPLYYDHYFHVALPQPQPIYPNLHWPQFWSLTFPPLLTTANPSPSITTSTCTITTKPLSLLLHLLDHYLPLLSSLPSPLPLCQPLLLWYLYHNTTSYLPPALFSDSNMMIYFLYQAVLGGCGYA